MKINLYDVLDRFYMALQNKNHESLLEFFSDEAVYDNPDLRKAVLVIRTKDAVVRALLAHLDTFSGFKFEGRKISVKENIVVVNWTLSYVKQNETTEKTLSGTDTFNFDSNGKIACLSSSWNPEEYSSGTFRPV